MRNARRGFSLLETLIAMILIGMAMTGLVVAFVGSSQFGVLARKQATAAALARSLAARLQTADYGDARLANANTANDSNWSDPTAALASATVSLSGANGADVALVTDRSLTQGDDSFNQYVTVSPELDAGGTEIGKNYAVVVTYRSGLKSAPSGGGTWYRAIAIGFRYNPANVGVGALPL